MNTVEEFCEKYPNLGNTTAAQRRAARQQQRRSAQPERPAPTAPPEPRPRSKASVASYTKDLDKQIAKANSPKVVSTTIDGRLGVRTRPTTDNGPLRRVTGRELSNALGWSYSAFMASLANGTIKERPVEKFDPKDPNCFGANYTFERTDAEAICRRAGKPLPT